MRAESQKFTNFLPWQVSWKNSFWWKLVTKNAGSTPVTVIKIVFFTKANFKNGAHYTLTDKYFNQAIHFQNGRSLRTDTFNLVFASKSYNHILLYKNGPNNLPDDMYATVYVYEFPFFYMIY